MKTLFKSLEELPTTLTADEIACVLGVSRSVAYGLFHTKGFPTLRIGKRMMAPKNRFIEWMDNQVSNNREGIDGVL